MVNVPNRAYVDVRLGPLKFAFCHFYDSRYLKGSIKKFAHSPPPLTRQPGNRHDQHLKNGAHSGNRTRDLSLTKGVLCH